MKILLGIDYGTGGCKVTAIDETGARIRAAASERPRVPYTHRLPVTVLVG